MASFEADANEEFDSINAFVVTAGLRFVSKISLERNRINQDSHVLIFYSVTTNNFDFCEFYQEASFIFP